jgi:hypothetical protein
MACSAGHHGVKIRDKRHQKANRDFIMPFWLKSARKTICPLKEQGELVVIAIEKQQIALPLIGLSPTVLIDNSSFSIFVQLYVHYDKRFWYSSGEKIFELNISWYV